MNYSFGIDFFFSISEFFKLLFLTHNQKKLAFRKVFWFRLDTTTIFRGCGKEKNKDFQAEVMLFVGAWR